jgi:hypothetical protein
MSIQDVDDEGGGLGQGQAELLDESFEVAALQWTRGQDEPGVLGKGLQLCLGHGTLPGGFRGYYLSMVRKEFAQVRCFVLFPQRLSMPLHTPLQQSLTGERLCGADVFGKGHAAASSLAFARLDAAYF